MSDTEWQVEMRTWLLRLELVLPHCLNRFIPIETRERENFSFITFVHYSSLTKGVELSLLSTHADTHKMCTENKSQ